MVELVDHDKRSSTRYFCLGAFCVLFGCVLLCALGFTVVYPYQLTRDWPNVTCHVTNVTYHYDICSCGQPYGENGECFGKYPCLQIGVKYNSTEKDMERSATLFRYWSDVFYGKCSLYECGDEHWNVRTVREFHRDFGAEGQSYQCYYSPVTADTVLLYRTSENSVIHALVWPTIILCVGSVVWIGMCMGCWKFQDDLEEAETVYR